VKFDPQKHRRSIRLKGYDYTQAGAYFVTVVTWHRDEILGRVINGAIQLSVLGQIVREEWLRSIGIRKEILLHEDEFIIMPNHLHGIIWIIPVVGAGGARPDFAEGEGARRAPLPESLGARRAPLPKLWGAFIAGYKSSVTSRARRCAAQPVYPGEISRAVRITYRSFVHYLRRKPCLKKYSSFG
jgi:hypothetical protein